MTDEEEVVAEASTANDNPAIRWYVVHAYSGFEPYVKKVLESRIASSAHKDKFGQILVPTEEVVEMRDGPSAKVSENSFRAMCWCKWKWIAIPGIW